MAGLENLKTYEQVKTVDSNGDKVVDDQGLKDLNVVLSSHDVVDATKKIAEKLDDCNKIDLVSLVSTLPATETNRADIQSFADYMRKGISVQSPGTPDQQDLQRSIQNLEDKLKVFNNSGNNNGLERAPGKENVSSKEPSPVSLKYDITSDPNLHKKNQNSNIIQYEAGDGSINTIDFQEILRDVIPKINEFTNDVNEGLKTGKFDMKKMEMYGGIGYILGELKGKFGNTIAERKVAIQKLYAEAPKMIAELNASPLSDSEKQMIKKALPVFKSVLDALADPNSQLSLYIDHIAEPLAQQINGTLDYSNLESDQSKKAILNIFHRNPIEFNRLIDDFSGVDAAKKSQAEQIIKAYYKIDSGDALPVGATVEYHPDMLIKQVFNNKQEIVSTTKKQGFQFKDSNGNILKEKNSSNELMLYFGEKSTGNAQSFEQLLGANGPQWAKDLYKAKDGTVQLDMKTVADLAQQVNFEGGTKVKPPSSLNVYSNMSEAIKGFFDHPLFKQLQEALYTLMGLVGTPEQREKAALDLNRMRSLNTIKANNDSIVTRKGKKLMIDAIKDNDYAFKEESMSYIDKNKQKQDIKINTKAVFVNMTYEEQKFFLENILSGDAQKVQAAKDSMIAIHNNENPISTNTDKSKDEASEKTQESSAQRKEFKDGALYPELSRDGKLPGKIEWKGKDTDTPYLIVDGQAIALMRNKLGHLYGSLCTIDSQGIFHSPIIYVDENFNKISIDNSGVNHHLDDDSFDRSKQDMIDKNNNFILNNIFLHDNQVGDKIPILCMNSSTIFSKKYNKVGPIYDEAKKVLPADGLGRVQVVFANLQRSFEPYLQNHNLTKEIFKNLIDKTRADLLTIKGSGSTPILQAQVDAWYSQFDFGASADKPSTQKQPVETPVVPVVGEKKV